MRIEDDVKLDYSDVLIRPKRSTLASRKEVDLKRTYRFKHSGTEWNGVPIMAANMDGVGTFNMAKSLYEHSMFTCFVKSYNLDDFVQNCGAGNLYYGNYVAVSTGTSDRDWSKLQQVLNTYPELHFICIDIANGYSEHFGDYVAKVRERYPTHTIIAGNVVTADMTQELILRGADIVKVGIGPGSVCTTRIQTGVGYPQLSAIIECADAAHGLGAHIIADGGCTCPGDVAKAFGAGADFVMLGGMLAGHDEGGGTIITKLIETNELQARQRTLADGQVEWTWNGNKVKEEKFIEFYGMSSDTAMEKHHGGLAEYRSSEGRTVTVPYKGSVNNTVLDILGGIRSTCTYVGAPSLKQLSKCTTFVKVNRQVNLSLVK
jgi:GMP reductase